MEMAVPFLSVPTMKSLSKQKNFANLNVAAVILAGVVALVGTTLGGAARFFRGDGFFNKKKPWFRTGNKKKSQKHKSETRSNDYLNEATSFFCFRGLESGRPHVEHIQQYRRGTARNRL